MLIGGFLLSVGVLYMFYGFYKGRTDLECPQYFLNVL